MSEEESNVSNTEVPEKYRTEERKLKEAFRGTTAARRVEKEAGVQSGGTDILTRRVVEEGFGPRKTSETSKVESREEWPYTEGLSKDELTGEPMKVPRASRFKSVIDWAKAKTGLLKPQV